MGHSPNWESIREGDTLPVFERTTSFAHWNRYAAVNDEFIVLVYFSVRDLRPVEDLQICLRFEEGEDLNAEGSQDEIGMPDTA